MRGLYFFTLALSTFFALVLAENGGQSLPECTVGCLYDLVPKSSCAITDQGCICKNEALLYHLTSCVLANCTAKEALTTQNFTANACHWPEHDDSPIIRDVTISLVVVTSLFVIARLVGRLPALGGGFGPDDLSIVVAWVLSLFSAALVVLLSDYGLGKDTWTVPFDKIIESLRIYAAAEKMYILVVWITKLSILLLYLRLFPDDTVRRNIKIVFVVYAAALFCLFFADLFKCWPISYDWSYMYGQQQRNCSNLQAQKLANTIINMIADVAVLLLPLPIIWKMNLTTSKKLAITAMFSVGFFVTVVSGIRTRAMKTWSFSIDPTRNLFEIVLWSVVEGYVGIICACMPGMRSLWRRIFDRRNRRKAAAIKDHSPQIGTSPRGVGAEFRQSWPWNKIPMTDDVEFTTTESTEGSERQGQDTKEGQASYAFL